MTELLIGVGTLIVCIASIFLWEAISWHRWKQRQYRGSRLEYLINKGERLGQKMKEPRR